MGTVSAYPYDYTLEYMYLTSTSLLRDLNKFNSLGTSLGAQDLMKSVLTDYVALSRAPSDAGLTKRLAVLRGFQGFCNDVHAALTNLYLVAQGSATWIVPTILDTEDSLVIARVFPELSVIQDIVSTQRTAVLQARKEALDSFIARLDDFACKYGRYYDVSTTDSLKNTFIEFQGAIQAYDEAKSLYVFPARVHRGIEAIRSSMKTGVPQMRGALNVMSIDFTASWSGLNLEREVVDASTQAYLQDYEVLDILGVYREHMQTCLQAVLP